MAQAILLRTSRASASAATVIDVSPGYLRNFLAPRKLAQAATPARSPTAKRRMEAAEQAARERRSARRRRPRCFRKTVLTISHPAGEDGRLFGSVTSQEIVDADQAGAGPQARPPQGAARGADPGPSGPTWSRSRWPTASRAVKTIVSRVEVSCQEAALQTVDRLAAAWRAVRNSTSAEHRGRGVGARRDAARRAGARSALLIDVRLRAGRLLPRSPPRDLPRRSCA